MTYEFLVVEIEENIAIITINRPPVNPLSTQVFKELSEVFFMTQEYLSRLHEYYKKPMLQLDTSLL